MIKKHVTFNVINMVGHGTNHSVLSWKIDTSICNTLPMTQNQVVGAENNSKKTLRNCQLISCPLQNLLRKCMILFLSLKVA